MSLPFGELSFQGGSWLGMAQDHVRWQDLVLAVLNLLVLLPES